MAIDEINEHVHIIGAEHFFPPVGDALPDGLLAIGGDLSIERLLLAYRSGIFPWYNEDEPPLWWSPDPRFVLLPDSLKVSKSMRSVLNGGRFEFRMNTAFSEVIAACRAIVRDGQPGTWITPDVVNAYTALHKAGFAVSGEAWSNGALVGGLYGVRIGRMFFGESMFSKVSNASKYAFIKMVRHLASEGVQLIDCQVYTSHLESLGAQMMPRAEFVAAVAGLVG